jgi:hypothetical protein
VSDLAGDALDAEGSPASDLLTVDIGSDRSTITVEVSYAGEDPTPAPTKGHVYSTEIQNGEEVFLVNIGVTPDSAWFEFAKRSLAGGGPGVTFMTWTWLGSIHGAVDRVHHRVRAWVPISLTNGALSAGRRVTLHTLTAPGAGMLPVPALPAGASNGMHPGVYSPSSDGTQESGAY